MFMRRAILVGSGGLGVSELDDLLKNHSGNVEISIPLGDAAIVVVGCFAKREASEVHSPESAGSTTSSPTL